MSNQIVQQIDLGLRILGVDQCEYAVKGVRGKTIGQAVGLASICRATALESGIDGYASIVRMREKKLQDLSDILTVLAASHAQWDVNTQKEGDEKAGYNDAKFTIDLAGVYSSLREFVAALDAYGITHGEWDLTNALTKDLWDVGNNPISTASMDRIQADANHKSQMEDTDLQSDMASLQSYISKRDSAFSTASEMQRKCDGSISAQMKYMTG